jgi:ferric-dicitrate binding protein FerR (iron transport regulator)
MPGQQALLSVKDDQLKIDKDVDLHKVMAWKEGLFEFDDTELADIMRQISRWYDVDIIYEGAAGTDKYGGGISKKLPLTYVLRMLEVNGVHFRLENNKLFVKP